MPDENIVALLEHHPMVGGEVGLALDAIDDQRVDELPLRDLEFGMGGKSRAAEADDAGFLNGREDFVGRCCLERAGGTVDDLLGGAGEGLEVRSREPCGR